MRILTVRQPWAWAIIHGGKDVENRVRNIAGTYRGLVAIHAGKNFDDEARFPDKTPLPALVYGTVGGVVRGAIIGVVDLVDVHPVANPHFHPICHELGKLGEAAARGDGACSPWSHPDGQWHLVFRNPRPLAEPIPFRGALGLRHLDDDTTARILAQIGDPR